MDNNRKVLSSIKNNYHYIPLALIFISSLYICLNMGYYNDDFTYRQAAVGSINEIIEFIKWHFENYNGRTLVHVIAMIFLRNKFGLMIWRVLCPAVIALSCLFTAKITADSKDDVRRGCLMSVFVFAAINPIMLNQSVYWLTGFFNYLFPVFILLSVMLIASKNAESKWLYPLGLISSLTVDQTSMMTVGLFALLSIDSLIRKKKFSIHNAICFVLSVAGCCTVLLAPGNSKRLDLQGKPELMQIIRNFIAIIRKNWLDNIFLFVMIITLTVFIAMWLYKFKGINTFTKVVNIPVMLVLCVLAVANTALKVYLLIESETGNAISFSNSLNSILFKIWFIYAFIFFASFGYVTLLIYLKKSTPMPIITYILGVGSQAMMSVADKYIMRACIPGIFMFMIFEAYSFSYFVSHCSKAKTQRIVVCLTAVMLAFACCFHAANGEKSLRIEKQKEIYPLSAEEMKAFEYDLKVRADKYYSGADWKDKYNIFDLSIVEKIPEKQRIIK